MRAILVRLPKHVHSIASITRAPVINGLLVKPRRAQTVNIAQPDAYWSNMVDIKKSYRILESENTPT